MAGRRACWPGGSRILAATGLRSFSDGKVTKRVSGHGYSPNSGRADVVTRRMTNDFHGMAQFNFRDESLIARYSGYKLPSQQSRYLHGMLEGPLQKPGLFGAVAVERRRSRAETAMLFEWREQS